MAVPCKKEGVVASDQSGYGLINALAVCMAQMAYLCDLIEAKNFRKKSLTQIKAPV